MRFLIRTLFALLLPAALLADGPLSSTTLSKVVSKSTISVASNGTVSAPAIVFAGRGANWGIFSAGASSLSFTENGFQTHQFWSDGALFLDGPSHNSEFRLPSAGWIDWNGDTYLYRDAAGVVNFRNGSNAETVRISGEHTDALNYSRGTIDTQTAGVVKIGSEKAGTGSTRAVQFISPSNFGFNGTSFGSGTGVLFIANGTAPSGTPTGGGILYVEAGALKFKGSSGTVTTIANP